MGRAGENGEEEGVRYYGLNCHGEGCGGLKKGRVQFGEAVRIRRSKSSKVHGRRAVFKIFNGFNLQYPLYKCLQCLSVFILYQNTVTSRGRVPLRTVKRNTRIQDQAERRLRNLLPDVEESTTNFLPVS